METEAQGAEMVFVCASTCKHSKIHGLLGHMAYKIVMKFPGFHISASLQTPAQIEPVQHFCGLLLHTGSVALQNLHKNRELNWGYENESQYPQCQVILLF